MPKKKQLNLTDQQTKFLFHHLFKDKERPKQQEIFNVARFTFINNKFTEKFSEQKDTTGWTLNLHTDWARFTFHISHSKFEFFKTHCLEGPAKFLSQSKIRNLVLYAVSQDKEFQMYKTYAKFCRIMKESNTLKSIELYIDTAWSIENRILMDMLPDVITKLGGCFDGARFLNNRRLLNEIELKVEDRYVREINDHVPNYYRPLLEAKTKKISLRADPYASNNVRGLDGIGNAYPLKPNKTLEFLKIFAMFISTSYEVVNSPYPDYVNMKEDTLWLETRFKQYKTALKALASLNSTFELKVTDYQSSVVHLNTFENLTEKLNLYLNNIKLFCDAAIKEKVNLTIVKVGPQFYLPSKGYYNNKWRMACIKLMDDNFGLKHSKEYPNHFIMEGTQNYRNVSIQFELCCAIGGHYHMNDPKNGDWQLPEYTFEFGTDPIDGTYDLFGDFITGNEGQLMNFDSE